MSHADELHAVHKLLLEAEDYYERQLTEARIRREEYEGKMRELGVEPKVY